MHDRVDAPERIPERGRIGEVAERDLHAHALVAEAAWVAHEGTHRLAVRGEPAQQRGSHCAGGAREQDHRPTTTTRQGERSLRCASTSVNPAPTIQPLSSEGVKLRLWLQA